MFTNKECSETRNDLVNQMTTAGIIENELNNAKNFTGFRR